MSTKNIFIAIIGLVVVVLLVGFGFGWFDAEDQAMPILPEEEHVAPEGEREVIPMPDVEQAEPTPPDDEPMAPQ